MVENEFRRAGNLPAIHKWQEKRLARGSLGGHDSLQRLPRRITPHHSDRHGHISAYIVQMVQGMYIQGTIIVHGRYKVPASYMFNIWRPYGPRHKSGTRYTGRTWMGHGRFMYVYFRAKDRSRYLAYGACLYASMCLWIPLLPEWRGDGGRKEGKEREKEEDLTSLGTHIEHS